MSVLLISYDLNNEKKRPDIVGGVKNVGESWARLSESSYAVKTTKSPETVHAELKKYTDSDDHIYIINLKQPYTGYGPKDVNAWLDSNLPW